MAKLLTEPVNKEWCNLWEVLEMKWLRIFDRGKLEGRETAGGNYVEGVCGYGEWKGGEGGNY